MLPVIAAMAQEVERRLGKAEATGSNPVGSFIFLSFLKVLIIFESFVLHFVLYRIRNTILIFLFYLFSNTRIP